MAQRDEPTPTTTEDRAEAARALDAARAEVAALKAERDAMAAREEALVRRIATAESAEEEMMNRLTADPGVVVPSVDSRLATAERETTECLRRWAMLEERVGVLERRAEREEAGA